MEKWIVTEEGIRLDKYLSELITESRSQIQNWIKEGYLLVNNTEHKANYKVKINDVVTLDRPEPKELVIKAENIPLDIIYQDKDVAVINKPQGMVVHPAAGHPNHTLVNGLLYHIKDLSEINGYIRPGIVHRIDKDTSGLLMIAKNDQAHNSLAEQLASKTTKREYLALVHGNVKLDSGTIDAPIGRNPHDRKKQAIIPNGKVAITHYEVLERYDKYTLIKCILETGRTHQIRVHMASIGHPLAGDPVYGPRKTIKGNGQFLHAGLLGFTHPRTGEWLEFTAKPPVIFQETITKLQHQTK